MEVESECRSPLLCADGDGNDESVPCSQSSSAPQTQQLLEQFDRSVKFADENVSPEAYHSKTDIRFGADLSLHFAILEHIFVFVFLFNARILIARYTGQRRLCLKFRIRPRAMKAALARELLT
jgi:hypothetical protein